MCVPRSRKKSETAPFIGAPASCRLVERKTCANNVWSAGILPARGAKNLRQQRLERRHLAGQWNISIDSEFEKPATEKRNTNAGKMPALRMVLVHAGIPRAGKMPALQ
jgi:hypothetical protein